MRKKRNMYGCIIMGLLTIMIVGVPLFISLMKVNANPDPCGTGYIRIYYKYDADFDPVETFVTDCPTCSSTIPVPSGDNIDDYVYSTIQITDGEQAIIVTVCSERLKEAYPVLASKCQVFDDDFPTPLDENGKQNANYHGDVTNYLSQIWGDGQFNGDNPFAQAISEVWCNGTKDMAKCTEDIIEKFEDGGYLSEEVYPGLVLRTGDNYELVDARKGLSCEEIDRKLGYGEEAIKNHQGVACAIFHACQAAYTYGQTEKGDFGVCNALPDLETGVCPEDECCECIWLCLEDSNSAECKKCRDDYCSSTTPPKTKTCPNGEPIPSKCETQCENPDSKSCEICLNVNCESSSISCESPTPCGDECYQNEKWPDNILGQYSCGENYEGTYYTEGEEVCDSAIVMIEEKINITNIPASFTGNLFAGQGFDWGSGVVETITTKTRIYGSMKVISSKKLLINENENLQKRNDCLDQEIDIIKYALDQCSNDENCKNSSTMVTNQTKLNEKIAEKNSNTAKIEYNKKEIQKKEDCLTKISQFNPTSTVQVNILEPTSLTMNIGNYTQNGNTVKAIEKNSGTLLFTLPEDLTNYYLNNYVFFIPVSITNVSNGEVKATYSTNKFQMNISCPIAIKNELLCDANDICGNGGLDIIYRPVSLSNPFPNTITTGLRFTLGFWSDQTIYAFITNNRNVSTYEVYNQQPMYTITLTPLDIKMIREYNKTNSLNDFNMECTNGLYCHSNFLEEYEEIFDLNNSCAYNVSTSNWYACDDEIVGNTRDKMLKDLKSKW